MFKELVKKNRSYRAFAETPRVTREQLADWVDTARYAASSVNVQPLKYRLVTEPDECAALFPLTAWARRLPDYAGPPEGHRPTGYVAVCCDTRLAPNPPRFDRDVGIVSQTILLAAVEAGFGGCMIGNFKPADVAACLALPDWALPCLLLAVGIPGEPIVLEEAAPGADVGYYRDADFVHHVPKRPLNEILL